MRDIARALLTATARSLRHTWPRRRKHASGFALPMAMTISIIVALLMTTALDFIQSKSRDIAEIKARAELAPALHSLLSNTMLVVLAAERNGVRADFKEEVGQSVIGAEVSRIYFDGTPIAVRVGDRPMEIRIIDESAIFLLNAMSVPKLKAWFVSHGIDERKANQLAEQIHDYRDPDSLRRPDGAETYEYQQAGRRPPKNRLFTYSAELANVLDFHSVLGKLTYDHLLELGFSQDTRVNVNAASDKVLTTVLGLSPSQAERMIQTRRNRPILSRDFDEYNLPPVIDGTAKTWNDSRLRIEVRDLQSGMLLRRSVRTDPPQPSGFLPGIAASTGGALPAALPSLLFEVIDTY